MTLTGLSSDNAVILSFDTRHLPSIQLKNEISIDDDTHRETGPDGQRWLNTEAATDDLLACLIEGVACTAPHRLEDRAVIAVRI